MMIAWGMIVWGLAVFAQDPPVPGSAEAEADEAIAVFKETYNRHGTTEDEQVLAIRKLGTTIHAKTLAVLAPLMTEGRSSTRIAAALVLADFGKIEGTPKALIWAYDHTEKKTPARAVRIRIIQSLGELKADAAAGLINLAILDRDPWIARAAAKAAARMRGSSSIEPLIRRLHFLESREGERPATDGHAPDPKNPGSDGNIEGHHRSERQVLQSPIHEALTAITRQRHTCAETWAKWWSQNRKDYKVPK
jgi:HEAT repeat protein